MNQLFKTSRYAEPVLIEGSDFELRISANNEEYVHFCTDIDYMLGLKSVEALDPKVLAEMQRMNSEPSPKVSDDLLFQFCKSRYIQEPADCERWYNMLDEYAKNLDEQTREQLTELSESEINQVTDNNQAQD